jgi:5-methylcytosine-specific restriction protein A
MTGFSKQVRDLVAERASIDVDDPRYVVCEVQVRCPGRAVALYDLHHRRCRGAGGSKRPETNLTGNALAVCRDCHSFIESQRETAYSNGWLVRQHQEPALIPVLRRQVWVLLDNQGGFERASCVCGEIGSGGRFVPDRCVCVEER